jgi:hypothetical protein
VPRAMDKFLRLDSLYKMENTPAQIQLMSIFQLHGTESTDRIVKV